MTTTDQTFHAMRAYVRALDLRSSDARARRHDLANVLGVSPSADVLSIARQRLGVKAYAR